MKKGCWGGDWPPLLSAVLHTHTHTHIQTKITVKSAPAPYPETLCAKRICSDLIIYHQCLKMNSIGMNASHTHAHIPDAWSKPWRVKCLKCLKSRPRSQKHTCICVSDLTDIKKPVRLLQLLFWEVNWSQMSDAVALLLYVCIRRPSWHWPGPTGKAENPYIDKHKLSALSFGPTAA